MTTDQQERTERSGFRLPWSHDRRSTPEETNEQTAAGGDVASWVLRAGAPATTTDDPQGEMSASEGVTATADVDESPEPRSATEPSVDAADDPGEAAHDGNTAEDDPRAGLAWPAEDVRREPSADAAPAQVAGENSPGPTDAPAEAPAAQAGGSPADDSLDGGEADDPAQATTEPDAEAEADSEAAATDPAATPPPVGTAGAAFAAALTASSSRPTAFLKELTKAMQAAATTARDEAVARLAEMAKQRTDEIQQAGATRATRLRRSSEEEVAATREWSKAEIARIREETDQRIAERKARLESELEQHAELVKRRTEEVHDLVEAHEQELAAFVERLMAEEDPTTIASLAQELPEMPTLPELDPDDAGADDAHDVDGATASVEATSDDSEGRARRDGEAGERDAQAGAGEPQELLDASMADGDLEIEPAEHLTAEFAAAAEAEALAGLDGEASAGWLTGNGGKIAETNGKGPEGASTELLVSGLASVAGIAGFKRELSRLDGVKSVTVSAGQAGDFVFAVTHAPELEMAAGVASITSFAATVHDQQEDTLLVSATEPDSD